MIERVYAEPLSDGELLRADGSLDQIGYAFDQVKRYSRDSIVKRRSRIKERDCYYFGDDRHAVVLSLACYAHTAVASVTVLDFEHITAATKRKFSARRGTTLPSSVDCGDIEFDGGGLNIVFAVGGDGKRTLKCSCKDLVEKKDLECEINLDAPVGDNITAAMPFDKPREFLYETRLTCLKGTGRYTLGDERVEFSRSALGELEWSRGVYPHKTVWYRAGLSAEIDGNTLGLSLGRIGVGTNCFESAIFVDGKAERIEGAKFEIPFTLGALDYLKPWRITDNEGRIGLMFYPMLDTEEKTRIGLCAAKHKVFGKYYGKATLSDGTIIDIADRFGYAEHMTTHW